MNYLCEKRSDSLDHYHAELLEAPVFFCIYLVWCKGIPEVQPELWFSIRLKNLPSFPFLQLSSSPLPDNVDNAPSFVYILHRKL